MSKDYDMNIHYHSSQANLIVDALSRMIMGSTSHVEDEKKELVKDMHRLARLGVRLVDSPSGGVSVRSSSESSLVVEVQKGQLLDPLLMELNDSVFVKMNESFSLGGDSYQDRLCVSVVDDSQTKIVAEDHGSRYSIHLGSTKMYQDLK